MTNRENREEHKSHLLNFLDDLFMDESWPNSLFKKNATEALDQAYQYWLQQWRREGIDDTLSSLPIDFSNMADPRYETIARLQEWYIAKHKEMLEPLSTDEK